MQKTFKLFSVLMGGDHPRAKIEVHDIVFAVSETLEAGYEQLRRGWFGTPKSAHIDAWMEAEGVDGYRFDWSSEPAPKGEPRLYFLNFGGYEEGAFGETHRYLFVVAPDAAAAKRLGKERVGPIGHGKAHVDALLEVDALLDVGESLFDTTGRHLRLVPGNHPEIISVSRYIPL